MVICKKCLVPMRSVMSFSIEKREKYYQCPKCRERTKSVSLKDFELTFGEKVCKTRK